MNRLIVRSNLSADFFRDVAPDFSVKRPHGDGLPAQIRIDVKERPGACAERAEVPGVSREDIDNAALKAEHENGVLQLTWPRKRPTTGQRPTIE